MTEQQKKFILENYGEAQTNSIALSIGVSTATVIRWAKRMGMKINSKSSQFVPTMKQAKFIIDNYGEIPCRVIADELGLSISAVRAAARRMGLKITKEQLAELKTIHVSQEMNPNPITPTTKMLVCRYSYNGDSPATIAFFLGRSVDQINTILQECIENGSYIRYNLFGR
ncbi:MAG: hypothetical protein WCX81_02305 [Monoglobales bacterium]